MNSDTLEFTSDSQQDALAVQIRIALLKHNLAQIQHARQARAASNTCDCNTHPVPRVVIPPFFPEKETEFL